MVIGDSYVSGHPLANINEVWWRQLQFVLASRGYNDVEVIGVCSYPGNTKFQLFEVQQSVKLFKPDILIWGYNPNDSQEFGKDGMSIIEQGKSKESSLGGKFLKRTFRTLLPNIAETVLERLDRQSAVLDTRQMELKYFEGENRKLYRETLAQVGKTFKDLKIPAFMITLPAITSGAPEDDVGRAPEEYFNYLARYYKIRFDLVFPMFREFGIKSFDITDSYIKALRSDSHFLVDNASMRLASTPADAHPGAFITHFYATQAADILEHEYAQTLGPKTTKIQPELRICDWVPYTLQVSKFADSQFLFYYPKEHEIHLEMPLRKPHVQFNFEAPIQVKTIRLSGGSLREAHIWLTAVDPVDGYDRHILHDLKEKHGYDITWELPNEPWTAHVNTCKISAKLKGSDNRLILKF